jgi:hypothetical protein
MGNHAAASSAAEELAQAALAARQTDDIFSAACLLAGCVPLAEKDEKLDDPRRRELAEQYGARAVALLREAVQLGLKDTAGLRTEELLNPIRSRKDFQTLLRELSGSK